MRKVLSLILVIAVCFGLCACGETGNGKKDPFADIKSELVGRWSVEYTIGQSISVSLQYQFKSDETFTVKTVMSGLIGDISTNTGTYTIQDGKITLYFYNDADVESGQLTYNYQNGTLSVYANEHKMNKD